jgi:hypothetical protein
MNECRGEKGFAKGFFLLLLFVGVAVVLVFFAKPYIRYNTMRSHTKDILMMELGNKEEIKEKIMKDAKELHIPLDEDNVSVTSHGDEGKIIWVDETWSETVDFWGYYQKRLDFKVHEEY